MIPWFMALFSVALVIWGDDFVKQAAVQKQLFGYSVLIAALLYSTSAPFWAYVLQTRSLAQMAIMYSSLTVVGLYLLGWLRYGEVPTGWQLAAAPTAILAVVMSEI